MGSSLGRGLQSCNSHICLEEVSPHLGQEPDQALWGCAPVAESRDHISGSALGWTVQGHALLCAILAHVS